MATNATNVNKIMYTMITDYIIRVGVYPCGECEGLYIYDNDRYSINDAMIVGCNKYDTSFDGVWCSMIVGCGNYTQPNNYSSTDMIPSYTNILYYTYSVSMPGYHTYTYNIVILVLYVIIWVVGYKLIIWPTQAVI